MKIFEPTPKWHRHAACIGMPPDVFFPERGDSQAPKEARAICATCPVIRECRDDALSRSEKFGVWGGLGRKERKSARRHQQAAS